MLLSRPQLTFAALATGALVITLGWLVVNNERLRTRLRNEADPATVLRLERQVAQQTEYVTKREAEIARLLADARRVTKEARKTIPIQPVTSSNALKEIEGRAAQLVKDEKYQEALDEYVRYYRELRAIRPGSSECQRLMSAMFALGQRFAPARAALSALRDEAMAELQQSATRRDVIFEIALLNRRLGEGERTIALMDAIPAEGSQRQTLARIAFDSLVEARRYRDAVLGKPFGEMLGMIEAVTQALPARSFAQQAMMRESTITTTLRHIEVLAGAGRAADARLLVEKLRAFDNSATTQVGIEQHLARAKAPAK